MAATDYLTMQRVKSMNYSIPEQCDQDAASLIRALLVGRLKMRCVRYEMNPFVRSSTQLSV